MKKTLLVTLDFSPNRGGVSRYWESLLRYLPNGRVIVLTVPLPSIHVSSHYLESGVRVYRHALVSRWWHPHWLPMVWHVCSVVQREKIEHIIAGQILPVGTAVMIAALLMRVPYSVSAHGMDVMTPLASHRKKRLCAKILFYASEIIANSVFTADQIARYGIDRKKITLIYPCPGITPELFPHAILPASIDAIKKILLTVSRLVRRKGFDTVLHALSVLQVARSDIHWVIIGEGPYREEMKRQISVMKLENMVTILGALEDAEVAQWYRASTVFILTPFEEKGDVEGFGIVYLEANAFGKPVIGTVSGGITEAILNGKTGLAIEPRNSRECADAIERLCNDREFAHSLGKGGQERVEKEFQWKDQAERLRTLLT